MICTTRTSMITAISIFTALLLLAACSTQRVPGVIEVRADKVPEFSLSGALFIRNAQTDAAQKNFGKVGVVQVEGSGLPSR